MKKSFDKVLKYASKKEKGYLKEFLSYSDLRDKVKHLDFIPQEMIDAALEKELLVDEEVSFSSLMDVFNARNAKQMKQIIKSEFDDIESSDLNFVFIACLYQGYFEGIKALLSCAEFRKYLVKGHVLNIFEILNDCLQSDDKQDQEIAEKIIDQMCGYKKLKKWVFESVAKSDYQALKKYLKF